MFHQRTKHIDIRYHFLRNAVIDGTLDTFYCPTTDMIADIMTKALPRAQHAKLTEDLGITASLRGSLVASQSGSTTPSTV